MKKPNVVVSLSGGMDSSTLLLRCLKEYENVIAVSFNYGQKHRVELERAEFLIEYLRSKDQKIKYQQIQLNGLSDLLNSTLVTGGAEVPEGHYVEENMKATVVPNRNKIFSSIIQAIALSTATSNDSTCDITMGIHAGDHAIYPDCRQEFRNADDHAFRIGNWDSERVQYYTPYLYGDKFTILEDGQTLCKDLGLEFEEVYFRTNTSYKPLWITQNKLSGTSGRWYSDYKSASSVERIEAFIKLGIPDPVEYADETGPVSWETAKAHVESLLATYNN